MRANISRGSAAVLGVVLIVLGVGLLASAGTSETSVTERAVAGADAEWVVEPDVIHFGVVRETEQPRTRLAVANRGSTTITIRDVEAT
jgi:hypothetical protein